ncbi:MAG: ribonucleoside triphosphate reductase [Candidatus Portnoybacteria bacterium CG06_land_8_20_14_3_00_39_12]|uniref:Ribonucleoside triphosphate reductase n=3 Tax=Candidatus Portnoyibacteriota TaxID=1817913 RepID=A0A2M8KG21_9BACT|nr:MAG: ribonucleoside triphosphate reductase [Parcubacteria group bacterium CG1_02_40_25]PIU75269.1 MAG: ribonucleoside triphosphate reductase [Candidatus Portnoybacteria bacterium CG06_land_8_20_14_3_00_39_12]PIZ70331.1 MAG: ribonucleoside triphosphate reductase [Candidatus Portnoybacteria bacterium CG_4_10_14_0_2_um_filter_39_11]PJE58862.1 MAG: ribonucleoside triphosphate reductase [Candidatus Portnoybacteria bacterium CG10_big_fil_rev_8_21_14_0_10_40_22]
MLNKITQVRKRNGSIVEFDPKKIIMAVYKALTATKQGDGKKSRLVTARVIELLNRRSKNGKIPTIEHIQDLVEEVLILEGFAETAKAYILYREQHRLIRESEESLVQAVNMVDQYLGENDWEVKENSNMAYSLQGLNNYIANAVTKKYWLERVYPKEIREANHNGVFHIHDLQLLAAYCCGWDLYDLLRQGFGGVEGKIECKPAGHLRTAIGQAVNFIYTLQGEVAGAEALSSFDTLLAPFVRYDQLNYKEVKQCLQEFIFGMNVPTRVGFQTPFSNITLDLKPAPSLAEQPVLIGGQAQKETYGEFQEEMNMINRAFCEVMTEGDAKGRVFTFPIPTYNITKDFDWDNPVYNGIWEMTAKYGIPYFANFINSDMDPKDARSMCCRLRLDNRELYKRGGGLFGAYPLTGSIGVVTINLPRLGYLSKSKQEFFKQLAEVMDLARESLEIKRKTLERLTEKGLYPYARHYLAGVKTMRGQYWANHFSTIGLIGMNEALLNLIKDDIASPLGQKLAMETLVFMREHLITYQKSTGNLYNLEATPAEGTSYRLARIDKEKYPDIIAANERDVLKKKAVPYYTNSTQLPVGYTDDLFEALGLQDQIQACYTGGTILHGFLGERLSDGEAVKNLVKRVFTKYHLPYFSVTPTFSICPQHGYIAGEHEFCPKCTIKQPCEVYSRVVGYLRPVKQWNEGKQAEFKDRKVFRIST